MQLSIILVNWNSADYLRACLESIYRHTHRVEFEILVIDNASPKPGIADVARQFPEIRLILSPCNLGFSAANNRAYRESRGEYLLFLNPDTLLESPSIDELMAAIEQLPDAGAVGCRHTGRDHEVQTSCIQKFPTIWNQITEFEVLRRRWPACPIWDISPLWQSRPVPVEVISGACLLIRRAVFEQAGRFSEDYFMYADDIDLCYQTQVRGYRNYLVPTVEIIHFGGQSSRQQKVSQWATTRKCEAMTQFCAKTRGPVYAALFRAALGCASLARLILLGVLAPFRLEVFRRTSAQAKWTAVLRWAVGREA